MPKSLFTFIICLSCHFSSSVSHAQGNLAPQKLKLQETTVKAPKPHIQNAAQTKLRTKQASITINGKKIDYLCTASIQKLATTHVGLNCRIFSISYIVNNSNSPQPKNPSRPTTFVFNGGPGSSTAWLHLGALGPKVIPTSEDGIIPLIGEKPLIDNPHSILDATDIVFIDAPTTGFSRIEKGGHKHKIHSYYGDTQIMADFIQQWCKKNNKENSPKYLIGESYGTLRAIGVCDILQNDYQQKTNGIVFLSGLINCGTIDPKNSDDLMYSSFLPTYAAVASYHQRSLTSIRTNYNNALNFSNNQYIHALKKGSKISKLEKQNIATHISRLIGIDKRIILHHNLRIHPYVYRAYLLRNENRMIGRFDGRISAKAPPNIRKYSNYDPAFKIIMPSLQRGMTAFLKDIQWNTNETYRIVTNRVKPWDFSQNQSPNYTKDTPERYTKKPNRLNLSETLEKLIQDHSHLKILVQSGLHDLASPQAGVHNSLNKLDLTDAQRSRISNKWYKSGHMFYFNEPDLSKSRQDILNFIH